MADAEPQLPNLIHLPDLPLDLPDSSQQDLPDPPPPPNSEAATEPARDPQATSEEDATIPRTPDVVVPDPQAEAAAPAPAPSLRSPKLRRKTSFKRKKPLSFKQRAAAKKKLALLTDAFRPVPFSPGQALANLNLAAHEALFHALGLWDFAHLPFDQNVRSDLLIPLIANYHPAKRCSFVCDLRVSVSRPDLARALMLPVKKDKSGLPEPGAAGNNQDLFSMEESISAIMDFMSAFLLFQFQDDACILPTEVVTAHRMVKEGLPHKVDWAGLLWMLVEKELLEAPNSGFCHYASHLQCLIKYQQPRLLVESESKLEPVPEVEVEVENSADEGMEEEDDNDDDAEDVTEDAAARVRSSDHFGAVGEEKCGPGLSLGLGGDSSTVEGFEEFKEGKEQQIEGENHGGTEHCLRLCNSASAGSMEFENLCNGDEEGRREEGAGEDFSAKYDYLDRLGSFDRLTSTDLLQVVDPVGEFLTMRSDGHKNMPLNHDNDRPYFSVDNGKRKISEIDDDEEDEEEDTQTFTQSNQQKRARSGIMWESPPSEVDSVLEQIQLYAGKARLLAAEKEQASINAHLQLQYLNEMLQQKDRVIQSLEKTRVEEQQKWHMEACRYEHELNLLGNLVIGYKRALNETRRAFVEYRKKYPQGDEPLYKDVAASGGLVLSTNELERERLGRENELRCVAANLVDSFEKEWMLKLEHSASSLSILFGRMMELEGKIKLLKERFAKPVTSDA
ncbi:uncharacterized protein LOC121976881 [Zingiber officinale]|uniref:Uncharacterized protein n=1 Tax=Zingiber officinale TaxID=94328 RepID=A0A8J5GPZ4_ZINOF|nr:uncharacterized protein LOC121976881 [Zingiber officinale]KAG6512672.1 hypothetical protein ZIOFF_030801 [Zingiber officinale]